MAKINKHSLKMRGLKAASGETKNYGYYSGHYQDLVISIHVPREGDDPPPHPLWAAHRISIHVPREGDDGHKITVKLGNFYFNPRPP